MVPKPEHGAPRPPKLLDLVRQALRMRHYSPRTERAYIAWIRRFIMHHGRRHPTELGPPEVREFLSHLAVKKHVSASTQNQALAALLFLYNEVLAIRFEGDAEFVRAKRPEQGCPWS